MTTLQGLSAVVGTEGVQMDMRDQGGSVRILIGKEVDGGESGSTSSLASSGYSVSVGERLGVSPNTLSLPPLLPCNGEAQKVRKG